jgi:predicted amidohydrolase
VPSSDLRLAVAQPPCTAGDVSATVVAHAVLVRAAAARVVVFPELSLTGYELDAPVLDVADPRLGPLVDACAITGTTALIGAPVAGPHIGMLAVDQAGARVAYRKVNPGTAEARRFCAGPCPYRHMVPGGEADRPGRSRAGRPGQGDASATRCCPATPHTSEGH